MATRSRELHAFSHPNAEDVWSRRLGPGLRGVLIGLEPEFRLPFEGYYAFLAIRNGVPVGYGGGWCLFETLEFGFNVFESFRQGNRPGSSARCLRAYHQVFRMRTVAVDPYQLGADNLEALRSRRVLLLPPPRVPSLATRPCGAVLAEESSKDRAATDRYRSLAGDSPAARARRACSHAARRAAPSRSAVCGRATWPRWSTRDVARRHGGDREAATRDAVRRVTRALGVRAALRLDGRRATGLPPVGPGRDALVPDLERWPRSRAAHGWSG